MLGLLAESITYLFTSGRTIKLIKNCVSVTNSSNPVVLAKNITLTVVDCCAPTPVRLAAHCVAASATIAASIISPNPVTIGTAIHLVTELYEQC